MNKWVLLLYSRGEKVWDIATITGLSLRRVCTIIVNSQDTWV